MSIAGAESVRIADGPRVRATDGCVCGWSVADAWAHMVWTGPERSQGSTQGSAEAWGEAGRGLCGGFRWGRGLGELCVRLCLGAFAFWTVFAQQEGLHVVRCQGQPRGCRAGRVGWCCLSQRLVVRLSSCSGHSDSAPLLKLLLVTEKQVQTLRTSPILGLAPARQRELCCCARTAR